MMSSACRKDPPHLIVAFPLSTLRQDKRIVDPEDTRYLAQYYLLENISRGVVSDSLESPDGYSPGLAKTWTRLSSRRWAFEIDPELRWSDGTAITASQIAAHLLRLRKGRHRHIVYLKNLASAETDGFRIVLSFKTPTNAGLIHELSLADSFLIHPRNAQGDWSIGSGPYVVERFFPGKSLTLRRNPNFPGSAEAPEHVELINVPWETRPKMFEEQKVDFYRMIGPHFARSNQPILAAAPKTYRGYPTCIYYLAFKPGYAPARSVAIRREIARIVKSSLSGIRLPELTSESQMVPNGFAGRLPKFGLPDRPAGPVTLPRSLTIGLEPAYRSAPQVADTLIRQFKRKGVAVEISYRGDKTSDLNLCDFVGNQRDALGSWRFLLSPRQGDLRAALPVVHGLITQAVSAEDPKTRDSLLRQIHRTVLADAYAIPLFIEPNVFLHSRRINLTRINRFDMRMRFYDVRWR
jgi:MarR-like DNA-binding transcriptional regulator SgrR of sgrS sRNA